MPIYHCNFGFPLLTDRSCIYCPSRQVEGRTEFAVRHRESWSVFEPPTQGIEERVYFHDMAPDRNGNVHVVLVNDDSTRDFAVEMIYPAARLPQFIEWKMTGAGHFVLGLEPANCGLAGRKTERDAGTLRILKPGETEEFRIEFRVLQDEREVSEAIALQPT
jgi:hypothetical protein